MLGNKIDSTVCLRNNYFRFGADLLHRKNFLIGSGLGKMFKSLGTFGQTKNRTEAVDCKQTPKLSIIDQEAEAFGQAQLCVKLVNRVDLSSIRKRKKNGKC